MMVEDKLTVAGVDNLLEIMGSTGSQGLALATFNDSTVQCCIIVLFSLIFTGDTGSQGLGLATCNDSTLLYYWGFSLLSSQFDSLFKRIVLVRCSSQ